MAEALDDEIPKNSAFDIANSICDILPPPTVEVGASRSMVLSDQVSTSYPRVPHGSILGLRQHSKPLIPDIYCGVMVAEEMFSAARAIPFALPQHNIGVYVPTEPASFGRREPLVYRD